jgi:hypothetical protein
MNETKKDLTLALESIETNHCDLYAGNYHVRLYLNELGVGCTDDLTLEIDVDIENDIDHDSWRIHWVSINSLEVYDPSDKLIDLDVSKERITNWIENNEKIYDHINDQLEAIAESSEVEHQLANLASREDF